ncbi:MAG: DegT/DnrJ/EryC1/StrS family aminotransferase [Polyangiaceae bacterium]|nr:DegT/DnrJ/EryC1/StrS family aminotransferase [Polyangiaceae bacterium]
MQIPIARPYIGEEEKRAVVEVLESGQLSQGPRVAEFEQAFAAYQGARFGVATCNGTAALTCALMAHGIGPGDEVIVPSFSFFATASSVLGVHATPVFADIDPETYCLSPESAEARITSRTRAIMPVHLYGHPADMPRLEAVCQRRGLLLLADAAQAHGAAIAGRRVGSWGTACFSFFPSKNMTTTAGGMVLTDDEQTHRRLRLVRHQGMETGYRHEAVGLNFRMTDLEAAIGLVQLGRLPAWLETRANNAGFYDRHITRLRTPTCASGVSHAYHQYTVRVPPDLDRDTVVQKLNERGIGARVYYARAIHQQPVFANEPSVRELCLPETERAARDVLSLPVHPFVTEQEREYIVQEVNALGGG